jgi:hypothetical protein
MTATQAERSLFEALRDATFPWNGAGTECLDDGSLAFTVSLADVSEPVEPYFGPFQYGLITDASGDGIDGDGPWKVHLLNVALRPVGEALAANPTEAIAALSLLWEASVRGV